MSMCRVISCVVGRGCFLWSVHSGKNGKTLLAFALLHFVLQGQTCPLFQVSLDFLLLHSRPLWWKGHFFLLVVIEGLLIIIELFNFSFFGISVWAIDLDYCDIEWFALEMNRDHSVIFEIAPMYCILDCFVDYEGYSIYSKGFLPTAVEIMVIWIKFACCSFKLLFFSEWITCSASKQAVLLTSPLCGWGITCCCPVFISLPFWLRPSWVLNSWIAESRSSRFFSWSSRVRPMQN